MVEILSGSSLPQVTEYRLRRQDRRPFWAEISSAPLRDNAGRNIGLLLILRDVSNRKRAEEQIQYQADLLQNVSDAIIATDSRNDIQAWNKAAERIYGWKAEEAIGKNFHSLVKPEYRFQSREEVVEILDREGAWSGEIIHHLRNGRQIPVQSTITILKDAAGARSGLVSSNHDISERLQAEERLRERDQLLKNLSAQVPGMIYTFLRQPDGSYRVPYSSNAIQGIFGVSPREVLQDARAIFDPILAEDKGKVVAAIEDSARTLKAWHAEYRVQLPGQPVRWMLGQSDPVRLADGSTLWYGFNTDITERKKAEELIRNSLKEKEVLLQEIHHRVKNNLQIISGLLSLQADQTAGKSLEEVFHESQDRIHTIALIHEKLYRSHNLAEIAFDDYLRALTENLFSSHGIAAGRVAARFDMEKILLTVETAIPLGLIVNELITNSLKHAFPGGQRGEIRIRLRGYEEAKSYALKTDSGTLHVVPTCELIIADDGVGLPPGFSLAQQKTLGMSLVSMLAKQLQAELKVKSGPGAEFRLVFTGLPPGSQARDERQTGGS
jgi:PAS domain S-box-containing protein